MAGNCRWLGCKGSFWPAASRKLEHQSYSHGDMDPAHDLNEPGSRFLPRQVSRGECSSTNSLIVALWDPELRNWVSHAWTPGHGNCEITVWPTLSPYKGDTHSFLCPSFHVYTLLNINIPSLHLLTQFRKYIMNLFHVCYALLMQKWVIHNAWSWRAHSRWEKQTYLQR